MRKQVFILMGIAILILVASPLWAQTGCTDSPEDPTVILALVGGAGALAASLLRFRRRRH